VLISESQVYHSIIYDAAIRILGQLFSHFKTGEN